VWSSSRSDQHTSAFQHQYAVRRASISGHGREYGLSDVRCGANLVELSRNLEAETRLECQAWPRVPMRRVP
ncbi:hypothetical protein, partial [Planomonospora algeriensis]